MFDFVRYVFVRVRSGRNIGRRLKVYDGKCYISHSACPDDANEVAELVKAGFSKIDGEVLINSIGTTIGSHSGPGTVALFFWGDKRVD